jgi:hypothetical protein
MMARKSVMQVGNTMTVKFSTTIEVSAITRRSVPRLYIVAYDIRCAYQFAVASSSNNPLG